MPDARDILSLLAQLFQENGLDAVMLGNAGAALQGAPVTTVDVDFMFRPTRVNVNKLKKIAKALDATIFRPFYPISGLYRLSRESDLLQVDFMVRADGVRSFEGLRARASRFDFDGASLLVASLEDISMSKEAAGGLAIWPSRTPSKKPPNEKRIGRKEQLAALRQASDLEFIATINRWLDTPPDRRTLFLRRKTGLVGSAL